MPDPHLDFPRRYQSVILYVNIPSITDQDILYTDTVSNNVVGLNMPVFFLIFPLSKVAKILFEGIGAKHSGSLNLPFKVFKKISYQNCCTTCKQCSVFRIIEQTWYYCVVSCVTRWIQRGVTSHLEFIFSDWTFQRVLHPRNFPYEKSPSHMKPGTRWSKTHQRSIINLQTVGDPLAPRESHMRPCSVHSSWSAVWCFTNAWRLPDLRRWGIDIRMSTMTLQ